MGVDNLIKVFDESYYTDLDGGILELFPNYSQKYNNPTLSNASKNKIINSLNLVVSGVEKFAKYFIKIPRILDISDYNRTYLSIFSWDVLKDTIQSKGWEVVYPKMFPILLKKKLLVLKNYSDKI